MTVGQVNEPKSNLSRLATSITLSNNSPLSSNFVSVESQKLSTNLSANHKSAFATKPRAGLKTRMDTSFNQRLRRMMSKSGVTLVATRLIRKRNVSEAPCTHDQSLAARPSASYHHPSGHWSLGMTLFLICLLSALSTSSMVMCVPVRPQGAPGFPSTSHELDLVSNSRMRQFHPVPEQPSVTYSLQPKGRINLSSLLGNRPVAAASALASPPQADYFKSAATADNGRNHQVSIGNRNEQDFHPNHYNQFHQQEHFLEENNLERLPIQKTLTELGTGEDFDGVLNLDEQITLDTDYVGQPSSEWETVIDPHLYLLTEWKSQPYQQGFQPSQQQQRKRRNSGMGTSLSIVNPLDVLRQRLLLEIVRRRMRETQNRITNNDEFLRKIGR